MNKNYQKLNRIFLLVILIIPFYSEAQHSVAREWNEVSLEAVRMDQARPTVIARNLFHTSAAMYDAWALFDDQGETYLIGKTVDGYNCPLGNLPTYADSDAAMKEAMAHASYTILMHRYAGSPGNIFGDIDELFQDLMTSQGYDFNNTSLAYPSGDPAALGNFIGQKYISYGLQDGSFESVDYANQYYNTVNPPIEIDNEDGNPNIIDPNRWQPIELLVFIDQFENNIGTTPTFLSPEWGNVSPFAMTDADKTTFSRNGNDYQVYHDPGVPPIMDTTEIIGLDSEYKWGFSMVSVWGAHLDPQVGATIDVSPASIGNNSAFPTDFADYDQFYDFINGGDQSQGHAVNPATGMPYTPQMVPLGDYARILAEFWADGPDSEAPPGHWYTILNYVMDHPDFTPQWEGSGPVLDQIEYDVKAYFALGGAMHDAAIAAWGIKGWYDYIRPLSAIRCMAEYGQCTDQTASNFHAAGIPLVPGYIETVEAGDPLAGGANENVGKIKLYTWGGPQNITYLEPPPGPGDAVIRTPLDSAGVSWILAETWRPYQRPTFTTPPFAGYVSGHSTYSRAAAEVLTLMTGDEYFPGGMGEFFCEQDNFLVFEVGPSIDVTLQWATYRDASDQCSLSRIWGGIHPPADDIPGRIIGEQVGINAFNFANEYIDSRSPQVSAVLNSDGLITDVDNGNTVSITIDFDEEMDTSVFPTIDFNSDDPLANSLTQNNMTWSSDTQLVVTYDISDANEELNDIDFLIYGATDLAGNSLTPSTQNNVLMIDTYNPSIQSVLPLVNPITDSNVGTTGMALSVTYDDAMNTSEIPILSFPVEDPLANTMTLNAGASYWQSSTVFVAVFEVQDANEEIEDIDLDVSSTNDENGNPMNPFAGFSDLFDIDMSNPSLTNNTINELVFADPEAGSQTVVMTFEFDEDMDQTTIPTVSFPVENPELNSIQLNTAQWISSTVFQVVYDLTDANEEIFDIDIELSGALDINGNPAGSSNFVDFFGIDTRNPVVTNNFNTSILITDNSASSYAVTVVFDEVMDLSSQPQLNWTGIDPSNTLSLNSVVWSDSFTAVFEYDVIDNNEDLGGIDFEITEAYDVNGNESVLYGQTDVFSIEMLNPDVLIVTANTYDIIYSDAGTDGFTLLMIFDEAMNTSSIPSIAFPDEDPSSVISLNTSSSEWINNTTYIAKYDVDNTFIVYLEDIDLEVSAAADQVGNPMVLFNELDYFDISVDWNTTDISEIDGKLSKIFPNPVKSGESIMIDIENAIHYNLNIYSFEGKEIEAKIISQSDSRIELNSQGWAKGVYAIHLYNDNEQLVFRLVVN